ncbi:T9SS type A sorting domain-containing protein, partial [Rubrivirga sp.]|uniref:T9SS type A sorting domain-containing protein n=1 Tax=Rubrivirga sp. TaxID=1885344 RepID=UPI003C7259DB
DLHLLARSPATNFGDTGDVPQDIFDLDDDGVTGEILPFDLDGEDRVQDGRVDLGAYEGVETPVSSESGLGATALALSPAAPNPMRDQASLGLALEAAGPVEVAVFDLLGRAVAQVHSGPLAAGQHVLEVDASALPSGIYVVRASSRSGTATQRVTVVR